MDCPEIHDWILQIHEEFNEPQNRSYRAHLAECSRCKAKAEKAAQILKDLAAPIHDAVTVGAVDRIMERVDRYEERRRSSHHAGRWWIGGLAAAAALAIGVAPGRGLLPGTGSAPVPSTPVLENAGEFKARAATGSSGLRRAVGVQVYALEPTLRPLQAGSSVSPSTAYTVSYRNLDAAGTAYLMVFAVDRSNTIHWLHPAYTDASQDPRSVPLEHSEQEFAFPESVVLEEPAKGELRLMALISPHPLRVKGIEALGGDGLRLLALRQRFADADVRELSVFIQ